ERLVLVACLLAVIPALNLASSDAAAVAGLVMTVLTVGLVSRVGKSLPRFWPGDFFPTFYGCHRGNRRIRKKSYAKLTVFS
ncbi:TraX family protein, partial [Escherichia coli]